MVFWQKTCFRDFFSGQERGFRWNRAVTAPQSSVTSPVRGTSAWESYGAVAVQLCPKCGAGESRILPEKLRFKCSLSVIRAY